VDDPGQQVRHEPGAAPVGAVPGSVSVVVHRGRRRGLTYRTPLGAFQLGDMLVIGLMYGETDWCRNVLAAGGGELLQRGRSWSLINPDCHCRAVNRRIARHPVDSTRMGNCPDRRSAARDLSGGENFQLAECSAEGSGVSTRQLEVPSFESTLPVAGFSTTLPTSRPTVPSIWYADVYQCPRFKGARTSSRVLTAGWSGADVRRCQRANG
jgi:hypothetical protein